MEVEPRAGTLAHFYANEMPHEVRVFFLAWRFLSRSLSQLQIRAQAQTLFGPRFIGFEHMDACIV